MSGVLDIFNAVEGLSVTVGSTTPAVHDLDELQETYEEADLPKRVLLPWTGRGAGASFAFIAYGTPAGVDWKVVDLLLWRKTGMGRGVIDIAATLASYAGAYMDVLRSNRGLVTTTGKQTEIIDSRFEIGPHEYPEGSSVWYDGVKVILTLREYMTG